MATPRAVWLLATFGTPFLLYLTMRQVAALRARRHLADAVLVDPAAHAVFGRLRLPGTGCLVLTENELAFFHGFLPYRWTIAREAVVSASAPFGDGGRTRMLEVAFVPQPTDPDPAGDADSPESTRETRTWQVRDPAAWKKVLRSSL